MRSLAPPVRVALASIGGGWLMVDLLLLRIATLGSFSDVTYLLSHPTAVVAGYVLAMCAAFYFAARLILAPNAATVQESAVAGVGGTALGATLAAEGHDSGLLIVLVSACCAIASIAFLLFWAYSSGNTQ